MRVAQSRSRRCLRGLAVATFAAAPVLTLAVPAHADELLNVLDAPSTDGTSTTTTTVPEPAPLEGTPTTPPSTEVTVPTTEVTVPTTEATVPTTTPPSTDTTSTTTDTTTATTVPAAAPVVTPTTGPPSSGSSAGSTRDATTAGATKAKATKNLPEYQFFVAPTADGSNPAMTGGLQAVSAVVKTPVSVAVGGSRAMASGLKAIFGGDISPVSSDRSFGGLASAAPRFAPWIVLLAMAWIVRTVIGSILADRTAGPRRRRWTLL